LPVKAEQKNALLHSRAVGRIWDGGGAGLLYGAGRAIEGQAQGIAG